jgi:hypothetical protein
LRRYISATAQVVTFKIRVSLEMFLQSYLGSYDICNKLSDVRFNFIGAAPQECRGRGEGGGGERAVCNP